MVALGLDLARHVVLDVSMKREGLYDHGNCYRLRSFEAFVPELTITFDCVVTIALAFMVLVTAVVEDLKFPDALWSTLLCCYCCGGHDRYYRCQTMPSLILRAAIVCEYVVLVLIFARLEGDLRHFLGCFLLLRPCAQTKCNAVMLLVDG